MTIASDRVLSPKSVTGTPLPTKPLKLEERGGYLVGSDSNRLDYQQTVIITDITITAGADVLTFTCNDTVRQGQTITYYADRSMRAMKLATIRGNKLSGLYNPATLLFESLAFEEGVIKKTTPAVPTGSPTWFYHYYLKDHLGSTRMVVRDNGTLVEATMYHPYGTMDPIVSGTDAVRERFTGKELDKDGKTVSGAPGLGLIYFGARYYDPDVGVWIVCDPYSQYFNRYRYSNNPLVFIDPDGSWFQYIQPFLKLGGQMAISGGMNVLKNLSDITDTKQHGISYYFAEGAVSGAARFASEYLLSNIIPTAMLRNPTALEIVNGGLEVGMSFYFGMMFNAAWQQVQTGQVDWSGAFKSGVFTGSQSLANVITMGSLVNPRSMVSNTSKLSEAVSDARSLSNWPFRTSKASTWEYHPVRIGGLYSLTYSGAGKVSRFFQTGNAKMIDEPRGWSTSVMEEYYHLYSGGKDYEVLSGPHGWSPSNIKDLLKP